MRPRLSLLRLAAPPALLALAVAAGGCSLFDRSHDDDPVPTTPLPVPPPPPATSVFNLHRGSDDNANVIIEKVTLEPTATTVEMSYTNAGRT
ncbi:MAG: hypothetical protein R3F14_12155, partial [Polyangiaceae bacterium]